MTTTTGGGDGRPGPELGAVDASSAGAGRAPAPAAGPVLRPVPFRRLATRLAPGGDRIFHSNVWFRGHNNPRYSALLPRLGRVDPYLIVCSDRKLLRGVEFRALRATERPRDRALLAAANRRYRFGFMNAVGQAEGFRGTVVADVDDPTFSAREIELLNRPNVAAYVVTDERAARRFQDVGVATPYHVIPQGVSFDALDPERVAQIAAARPPGAVVVGYVAAWLLSAPDRGGSGPLYNTDHLLDLWEAIHARLPQAVLWLVGGASDRIRRRCEGRPDIVLFGRLPAAESLARVANFDIALYPRTVDQGISAVKVAEYMGLGVPTVSYDLEVTRVLRDTGSGVQVSSATDFVAAVERLALDEAWREQVAATARRAGRALDWTTLAARYEKEILDVYLR